MDGRHWNWNGSPETNQKKSMMQLGLFFLITTGISWVVIGIVISATARQGGNLNRIQADSAWICILVSMVFLSFPSHHLPSIEVSILLLLAGAANYFAFDLMNRAMQWGHHGIVWSMVQSALIWPFLLGVIVFDVVCTLPRGIGLMLILGGILLTGMLQKQTAQEAAPTSRHWFAVTLAAFTIAGLSQCLANLPSYLGSADTGNVGKAAVLQCGTLLAFCMTAWHNGKWRGKTRWKPVLILSGANLAAQYFLFYRGLDLVAQAGAGAIGYPVILGSSILGFTLYSACFLHEKITLLSGVSFASCLSGVILLSF